jgi:GntR family transcriptional regulator, carbon starvation induced regulator
VSGIIDGSAAPGGGSRNGGIRKSMTSGEGRQLSAGDSGYQRIRSDIIFGVLTPSVRLRLDAMKEDYGVSISTLREILNRLASEGFVVAEGQRGFEVAPVSIQNLRELAELRILLEHHAMAESFRAGDMEWEGRVVSAHHKLAATERTILTEGDDPELRKRYDGEFHQALISNCGSRELMHTHSIVFDKYFRYALRYRGVETVKQHKTLLDCALKRDIKSAKVVLTEHINGCVAYALSSWTEEAHRANPSSQQEAKVSGTNAHR